MEKIWMQAAIDAAWRSDEPDVRRLQRELFSEGKPDVDTFVTRIAEFLRKNNPENRDSSTKDMV